ncbi:hypothetical protein AB0957_33750, partial [Streptomyces zhihengii]|uniref:hypothetical protein n=1 Tax=Streptomyces zhihengii TaxID=1818004 RepID=UPI0034521711
MSERRGTAWAAARLLLALVTAAVCLAPTAPPGGPVHSLPSRISATLRWARDRSSAGRNAWTGS